MNLIRMWRPILAVLSMVLSCTTLAQAQLELLDPPPITGTFYFAQRTNVPPFWFDPYGGQLPVYLRTTQSFHQYSESGNESKET